MQVELARMKGSIASGLMLLIGALVVAVLMVVGLYLWDVGAREAEAALRPPPVAALAQPAETPVPPLVASSTVPIAPAAAAPAGDASSGQLVFASTCTTCHPNANAGIGPALHGAAFASRYPDDATLVTVIRQGKGGMPAFPSAQLNDQDLAQVVVYVRSLGTSEPAAEPTPTPRPRVRGG
jgi:mono/diheme cytochrome c family protein